MKTQDLKGKLESQCCHIHHEKANLIEDEGKLDIKTCCLLFKSQLKLLIEHESERKHP